MNDPTDIQVRYSTVDRHSETKRFETIEANREYARYWVGLSPEIGCGYAISGDGIGKIEVSGMRDGSEGEDHWCRSHGHIKTRTVTLSLHIACL